MFAQNLIVTEETDPPKARAHPRPRRVRRDWVRGEVRCLTCTRLVGRLLGSRDDRTEPRPRAQSSLFFAYRAAEPDAPVVRYVYGMRFHCSHCGGMAALDDVEMFSTYDEDGDFEDDQTLRGRPGRPRRHLQPCG